MTNFGREEWRGVISLGGMERLENLLSTSGTLGDESTNAFAMGLLVYQLIKRWRTVIFIIIVSVIIII